MATIYLVSDFGKLVKKGDVLELRRESDLLKKIFPFKTDQLIILGEIEITSPALKLLMRHNIDTVFLGTNGRFNGKIAFQENKNVFLRKKQYDLLNDYEFRLSFSKNIVAAKLKNQMTFLQRIGRKRSEEIIKTHIRGIKNLLDSIDSAEKIESLMGYEGTGARHFFSSFRHGIIPDWPVFNGRSMHPPRDNVNAVLSFLYTMILFRVDAALQINGLDPYVGYFHSLDYGKKALVFDLMEEYRTIICDTLTISLFNRGILEENDFSITEFKSEDAEYPLLVEDNESEVGVLDKAKTGVLLNKTGLKKVLTHFEKKLQDEIFYEPLGKKLKYKDIIFEQVKHFKRVLNGEEREYKPLVIK